MYLAGTGALLLGAGARDPRVEVGEGGEWNGTAGLGWWSFFFPPEQRRLDPPSIHSLSSLLHPWVLLDNSHRGEGREGGREEAHSLGGMIVNCSLSPQTSFLFPIRLLYLPGKLTGGRLIIYWSDIGPIPSVCLS